MTAKPAAHVPEIDNRRGIMWMFAASTSFATTTVMIRILTGTTPIAEVAFIRCLIGLVVIVPIIRAQGWIVFRTPRPDLHIMRVFFFTLSLLFGFYGVAHLPLATAVALMFTRPLFMIVIARVVLGERVDWRRALATIAGFIGVVTIVGPSHISDVTAALVTLAGAATSAASVATVRRQSAYDKPATMMVWTTVGIAITTAVPAAFVWQTPHIADWGLLIGLGILGTLAQYMLIRAYTHGEATVVNPIDYVQIVLTSLTGYFFFSETPTMWTGLGVVIIVLATLYIILHDTPQRKPDSKPGGTHERT